VSLATVLPVVKDLAKRLDGFSNADLAKAANINASAAGAYLTTYVSAGHVFKGAPEGKHPRYFDTAARAEAFRAGNQKPQLATSASREEIARAAVAHLRKQTLSSSALAELCKLPVAAVDAALAPLADAGKLTRVSVLRKGVAEFDYRWGATWIPADADFALCRADGPKDAPQPAVSPVAPPAPSARAAAPSSRAPKPATPALTESPTDSGRRGGASRRDALARDRAFSQTPQSLGWAPAAAPKVQPVAAEPAAPRSDTPCACERAGTQLEATDLVCALNSRGELALDLGDDVLVKFKPRHALVLTRFLAGNTVLEQMHARGEL
jgi:hypothetical protein